MAREYAKVYTKIWLDEVVRGLSIDGVCALFFVMTHPAMTGSANGYGTG